MALVEDPVAEPCLPLGTICEHPCLCGGAMQLRDSKYGLFYGCASFPNCEATVGAHQATGRPLGTPADKETKQARIDAHEWFDKLWGKGEGIPESFEPMRRGQAYAWLRHRMNLGKDECHIGLFSKVQCDLVGELVRSKLARMQDRQEKR